MSTNIVYYLFSMLKLLATYSTSKSDKLLIINDNSNNSNNNNGNRSNKSVSILHEQYALKHGSFFNYITVVQQNASFQLHNMQDQMSLATLNSIQEKKTPTHYTNIDPLPPTKPIKNFF